MKTDIDSLELQYEGSVKRVWSKKSEPEKLWFEFTDHYSVFDWGKMPDSIENKGNALAVMGAHFFETLSPKEFWKALPSSPHLNIFDKKWLEERFSHRAFQALTTEGAHTHFIGLKQGTTTVAHVSDLTEIPGHLSLKMEVVRAQVLNPIARTMLGNTVYFYESGPSKLPERRLIPLELVFRFGLPAGSSMKDRLAKDANYAKVLGLNQIPEQEKFFEHPVIELFTKLEPKDRFLSWQEAALMANLDPQTFEELIEITFDYALALFVIFAEQGIELWDGKIEMVLAYGKLMLADSIGPDELRLIYRGHHLSKEMLRQVYRGSAWEKSIQKAQTQALSQSEKSWKQICTDELQASPEPLPASVKTVVDKLYGVLANHLIGAEIFADQPTLDQFVNNSLSSVIRLKT